MRTFTRRDLFKAAGATLVVPRFISTAMAQPASAPPPMILLMKVQACTQGKFFPTNPNVLSSPILDPITMDAGLASKTTIIKGLYNREGGSGNVHDWVFSGMYSGYRNENFASTGPSIDQVLKQKTNLMAPFPTINCGLWGHPSFFTHQNRMSFSWSAARQQVPTEWSPYKLYSTVFGSAAPAGAPPGDDAAVRAAAELRLRQKKSVLDAVSADLSTLSRRLGAEERRKLEIHTGSIRELEQRLAGAMAGGITAPPPPPALNCGSVRPTKDGLLAYSKSLSSEQVRQMESQTPELTRLMFDFMATAITCNMTRIITFQFGRGGEHFFYGWLGVGYNAHDDVDHLDSGRDAAVTEVSLKINRWYSEMFLHLLKNLDRVPAADGSGTMLDKSLVVLGHDAATGTHGTSNIPTAIFGKAGGRLKKTGYMVDQGDQTYHRLGTSLLNIMGLPSAGLGDKPDCGNLAGLVI